MFNLALLFGELLVQFCLAIPAILLLFVMLFLPSMAC